MDEKTTSHNQWCENINDNINLIIIAATTTDVMTVGAVIA